MPYYTKATTNDRKENAKMIYTILNCAYAAWAIALGGEYYMYFKYH